MIGWHHRLDGHEFEQAPGDGERHGNVVCCSQWGRKELDMTEQLNCSPSHLLKEKNFLPFFPLSLFLSSHHSIIASCAKHHADPA